MLFLDEIKNVTRESEIYKHILKICDNLEKMINVQYAKRGTLTQVLDEIANIEEIKVEDTQGLLSVVEDIRNILARINDNIEGIKKLLEDINGIQDRLDNIIEQKIEDELLNKDIEYFYILYMEKINIVEDTNLSYEKIIIKSYEFVFLLVSKLNDEKKSKEIIDKLVNSNNMLELMQEEKVEENKTENNKKIDEDKDNKKEEYIDVFKNFQVDLKTNSNDKENSNKQLNRLNIEENRCDSQEKNDEVIKKCQNSKEQEIEIKSQCEQKEIKKCDNVIENNSNKKKISVNVKDNNVLIISQIRNKVFLPYKVVDIKRKYNERINEFNSIQDIISTEYVVPLNKYKNPVVARFKEAYNLMRKKEEATFSEALDLALEVTFKSNLNPAIITACNNLKELDKYLDCLEGNTLDKFNLFKVEYEGLPSIK